MSTLFSAGRKPLTVVFLLLSTPVTAWSQDSTRVELPPVRIEASRGAYLVTDAPASVAVLDRDASVRASEAALTLESVLTELPGLWIADRAHLALGERLVVRGLGSRAAFGVRSVAVLLDGVPLTMPDGQAVLDPIEPIMLARGELIRGPASQFWGNAAGGVLAVESGALPADGHRTSVRALAGSFGERNLLAQTSIATARQRTVAYASILDREGFREYSAGSIGRLGLRTSRALASGRVLALAINASDLDTESPGSLTQSEWEADPAAADARYINTRSGKRASQVQGSLSLTSPLSGGVLTTSLFGVQRSLDNPLPFAWVGVERLAGGARADWVREQDGLRWGLGLDARHQGDDRINANNQDGQRGTSVDVDQREEVSGLGASATVTAAFENVSLTGSLRADRLTVSLDDHIGSASGSESFVAASPSLGIAAVRGASTLFASVSTAFEIPTTTELVNSPDGSSGFNSNLSPQRVTGGEVGLRRQTRVLSLDLALYAQRLTNFLTPYQLEAFPGRTFYENVGTVEYLGMEAAFRASLNPWLNLDGTASVHRYTFASGALEGNLIPGIPMRYGSLKLTAMRTGLVASLRIRASGAQEANDENTRSIEGFLTADLRAASTGLVLGDWVLTPFAEVGNLTGADYVASMIPNARGDRYYEGLPGRTFRGGVSLGF